MLVSKAGRSRQAPAWIQQKPTFQDRLWIRKPDFTSKALPASPLHGVGIRAGWALRAELHF